MQQRFSKKIVALVILLNVAFTGAILYVYLKVGSAPDSLIAAWFAFTTGELWFLAGLRKAEMQGGGDEQWRQ